LAEPFDQAVVRLKPAVVTGNRALALAYVDAQGRAEPLGVDGWQDELRMLAGRFGRRRLKAAFSAEKPPPSIPGCFLVGPPPPVGAGFLDQMS
jgi:hypothetical protein